MKATTVGHERGYPLPAWVWDTFKGGAHFQKIEGPLRLVRLLQVGKINREGVELSDSNPGGLFWFEEKVLVGLRSQAARELAQQQRTASQPFRRSMRSLISMYVMHCLRNDLAICKNWTEDFDGYILLDLRPGESVIALVGQIKSQPYYAPKDGRNNHDPRYALAAQEGVSLLASGNQFVIDFKAPANKYLVDRIKKQRLVPL